jgi:NADH dehydrogenase
MARFSPVLPLIGGGKTRFQPVYVADVADAAAAILDAPVDAPFAHAGKTYELAGPRTYSFRELMELLLAEIGRRRVLLPVPWGLARLQASVLGLLPQPPLTLDQVKLLERDNIASGEAPGFAQLGIVPSGPEAILPAYLDRFRRGGGRFVRA